MKGVEMIALAAQRSSNRLLRLRAAGRLIHTPESARLQTDILVALTKIEHDARELMTFEVGREKREERENVP